MQPLQLGVDISGQTRNSKRGEKRKYKQRRNNKKRCKEDYTDLHNIQQQQNEENDMECVEEEYEDHYFLPVVFHSGKSYDAHFVIKHFKKQYT